VVCLMLAGCMPPADKACILLFSDFEQFEGLFSPLPAFLTEEQAHSGRHSYRMAPKAEFGPGYSTTLEKCGFVPRKMRLSGWVYLPSGRIRSTVLVVTVDCHGRRPDVWQGINIDESVERYRVWVPVQKIMKLPDGLEPTDELKFYVWHNDTNGELLFLDDLKLEAWE
jgi:hypothetical protein